MKEDVEVIEGEVRNPKPLTLNFCAPKPFTLLLAPKLVIPLAGVSGLECSKNHSMQPLFSNLSFTVKGIVLIIQIDLALRNHLAIYCI